MGRQDAGGRTCRGSRRPRQRCGDPGRSPSSPARQRGGTVTVTVTAPLPLWLQAAAPRFHGPAGGPLGSQLAAATQELFPVRFHPVSPQFAAFFGGKKGVDPKLPPSSPLPVASPKRGCHFLHRPKEGVDVGHEDSFAFEELPAGAGFFCKRRSGTKSDTHPGTVLRPTENAPKSHRGYSVLQM